MKVVAEKTVGIVDSRKINVFVLQCDFNAPIALKNGEELYYKAGHIELNKEDKVIAINNEVFCLINNSLTRINVTIEFIELNSPAIFQLTSFDIVVK